MPTLPALQNDVQMAVAGRPCPAKSLHAEPLRASSVIWDTWIEHQNYFVRRCLHWTHGNIDDAQDAIGQAWVKLLELDPAIARDVRSPKAWIATILRNICIDNVRIRSRDRQLACHDLAVPTPSPSPAPDADLRRQQLAEAIRLALTGLPRNLRQVALLRLINEQSYASIGATLDISVPNARKRLQQARALMQPELAKFND